jgi:hypothetical protein
MTTARAAKEAGFALAALLFDDRGLTHVRAALTAELERAARTRLTPREPGSASDKAALIAELLSAVRPALTSLPRSVPPRLSALLASKLPRALGRELVAAIPPAGPDFTPAPELLPRLLRIARQRLERERGTP